MDRVIYVAMSGAKQMLGQQSTVAHNLANASTTGFRAQLTAFRAGTLYYNVHTAANPGGEIRGQIE